MKRLLNFDTLATERKLNRNVSIITLMDLAFIASEIISLYDNLTVSTSLSRYLTLGKSYFSFNHRLILIRYLARISISSLRIGLNSLSYLYIKLSTSHLIIPKNISIRNSKIKEVKYLTFNYLISLCRTKLIAAAFSIAIRIYSVETTLFGILIVIYIFINT